jgi:hypothetical protein
MAKYILFLILFLMSTDCFSQKKITGIYNCNNKGTLFDYDIEFYDDGN